MVVEGFSERSLEAMLRACTRGGGVFLNLPALLIRLSAVQRPVGLFCGTGDCCGIDRVVSVTIK
jgi:hypothetical protein